MIISDVLLREAALNLLKVPVWDLRHVLHFFWLPSYVLVRALRPIDAEAESIVVTFSTDSLVRLILLCKAALIEAIVVGLTVGWMRTEKKAILSVVVAAAVIILVLVRIVLREGHAHRH